MRLSLYLSWKYLRGKGKTPPLVIWVSTLGIAIGFGALIVITSVIDGFQWQIQSKVFHLEPSLVFSNLSKVKDVSKIHQTIQSQPYVDDAILMHKQSDIVWAESGAFAQVSIMRFDQDVQRFYQLKAAAPKLVWEALSNNKNGVVMSRFLASQLRLRVGDWVRLNVLPKQLLAADSNHHSLFKVVGLFETGLRLFDTRFVMINTNDFDQLYPNQNNIQAAVRVNDLLKAEYYGEQLMEKIGTPGMKKKVWKEDYKAIFRALALERQVAIVIIVLIILVTLFNVISGIFMQIRYKLKDIALLQLLGMSRFSVVLIFIYSGLFVGVIGVLLGAFGGVLIASYLNELLAYFRDLFDPTSSAVIYLINFPVKFQIDQIVIHGLGIIAVCLVAACLPALFVFRLRFSTILRHEA